MLYIFQGPSPYTGCCPNRSLPKQVVECMQLFAWGWGRYGNLGDGEKTDRCAQNPPGILHTVVFVGLLPEVVKANPALHRQLHVSICMSARNIWLNSLGLLCCCQPFSCNQCTCLLSKPYMQLSKSSQCIWLNSTPTARSAPICKCICCC